MSDNKKQTVSAVALFKKSYELVKKNIAVFAVLFSVSAIVTVSDTIASIVDGTKNRLDLTQNITDNVFGNTPSTHTLVLSGAVAALVFVGAAVLAILTYIASLKAAKGEKLVLKELWSQLTKEWLWLRLIGLEIVAGVFVIIGFVLLIVPGVILLWRLYFASYAMIDENLSIEKAMSRSYRLSKGHGWSVYSILLLTVAFSLFAIIPWVGPLVSFAFVSAYTVAGALRYVELKKLHS